MVKKIIFFGLLGLVFVMSCKPQKKAEEPTSPTSTEINNTAPFTQISVEEMKLMLAKGGKTQILDVRTPAEVAAGTIAGATVIDIYDPAFMDKVQSLDKNLPTFVYCKVGGRSAKACTQMSEAGFTQLYNLAGGYDIWKTQE